MGFSSVQWNIAEANDWKGDSFASANKPSEVFFTVSRPDAVMEHVVEVLWFVLVVEQLLLFWASVFSITMYHIHIILEVDEILQNFFYLFYCTRPITGWSSSGGIILLAM